MSELMMAGVELMLLGMGIVFVFLTILIFTLRGMCALAAWLDTPQESPAPSVITVTDAGSVDPAIVAAISAAIKRYRTAHRG